MSKYLASFYYGVVTFSAIGYGDIKSTNSTERVCATCLALVSTLEKQMSENRALSLKHLTATA
jgi:hypothetical protein